jgi:hypothetical protein
MCPRILTLILSGHHEQEIVAAETADELKADRQSRG